MLRKEKNHLVKSSKFMSFRQLLQKHKKNKTKTINQRSSIAEQQNAELFKLNNDCLEDVFKWLSLADLYALSQTCDEMKQIAGTYFQKKYKNARIDVKPCGIYLAGKNINGFSEFIEKIRIYDRGINAPFQYIKAKCNKELKNIFFDCVIFDAHKIECIKGSLRKVEIIHLSECQFKTNIDLYNNLLRFCPNLKHLNIEKLTGGGSGWQRQTYSKLEHFSFFPGQIETNHELGTFFKKNASIKTIETFATVFQHNWHLFAEISNNLDELKLTFYSKEEEVLIINQCLVKMHEKGIYKRLYLSTYSKSMIEHMSSLPSLHGLQVQPYFDVSSLITLRELDIFHDKATVEEFEIVATKLVNLEKLSFCNASSINILPFVRHSAQLREINIKFFDDDPTAVFNLTNLNKHRLKLNGARKLVIYVNEVCFLATLRIRTFTNKNLDLVEVKRYCEKARLSPL